MRHLTLTTGVEWAHHVHSGAPASWVEATAWSRRGRTPGEEGVAAGVRGGAEGPRHPHRLAGRRETAVAARTASQPSSIAWAASGGGADARVEHQRHADGLRVYQPRIA